MLLALVSKISKSGGGFLHGVTLVLFYLLHSLETYIKELKNQDFVF